VLQIHKIKKGLNLDSIPFFCSIVGGSELKGNFGAAKPGGWSAMQRLKLVVGINFSLENLICS